MPEDTEKDLKEWFDFEIKRGHYTTPDDDYFKKEYEMRWICIHNTAGTTLSGAVQTLNKEDYIAVPYCIDWDGTIYEMYNPRYWAWHLGVKGKKGYYDKHSIGIEIVNPGPLVKAANGHMNFWPQNYGARYCDVSDTSHYYKKTFRGKDYYATYTEEQYKSAGLLCFYLAALFDIPLHLRTNLEYDLNGVYEKDGIIGHHHIRKDKYDPSPAFDWKRFKKYLGHSSVTEE